MGKIHTVVLGTAGHIDHGKSALVERLTGIHPDRLPEERERGMTIDLGFAPLVLSDGTRVGIVDVPGHERFVKNMVAGATGIDAVVLVVAADDGVMPQTREHLEIMDLLGLRRGLVAMTKVDLVGTEMADLVEEEIRETTRGTFLEGASVHRLSSVTGEGVEAFRGALESLLRETAPRSAEGVFRMPIQRVFSAHGHGTVVTGIPLSGSIRIGDRLEILPPGVGGRVRGLQAYRETVETARAGHSTAVNLSDVDARDVRRGHVVVAPGFFRPTEMIEGRLRHLARHRRALRDRTEIRFHAGTAEAIGIVVLLDRPAIEPGEEGLVQVRLREPLVVAPGDRFIVRLASPLLTLGGGVVLRTSERRLKRFKGLEDLTRAEKVLDDPGGRLEENLRRRGSLPIRGEDLARETVLAPEAARARLEALAGDGKARALRGDLWLHAEGWEAAIGKVRQALASTLARTPHRSLVDRLVVREGTRLSPEALDAVLEDLASKGEVSLVRGTKVRSESHVPRLSQAAEKASRAIPALLGAAPYSPPTPADLSKRLGAPPAAIAEALEHLADEETVVHAGPDLFVFPAAIESLKRAVAANIAAGGELDIPRLRDAIGTTRKYLIPLLEHLDDIGFTTRQGARRILKRGQAPFPEKGSGTVSPERGSGTVSPERGSGTVSPERETEPDPRETEPDPKGA